MTSAITAFDRPQLFVDEQVRGHFASWRHEHRFEATPSGGTRMLDVVEFRSPRRTRGKLVDRFLLSASMAKLIRQRNAWLVKDLEAQT